MFLVLSHYHKEIVVVNDTELSIDLHFETMYLLLYNPFIHLFIYSDKIEPLPQVKPCASC